MTLIIWTAADPALASKTFGPSLKAFNPTIPEHRFEQFNEEFVPEAKQGDVVLACGNKTLVVLQKQGFCPKNRKASSMREKPIKHVAGGNFLVTYDPAASQSDPSIKQIIDWDLRLAVRLMTTQSLEPIVGSYKWVNSYQPMIDRVQELYHENGNKPVDLSMDTETMGLYPWYDDKDIVSISFTLTRGTAELLYVGPTQDSPVPEDPTISLIDQIDWLLNSPMIRLRGANLKYDLIWIRVKWGLTCSNFKFDTMLVGSLLDENRSNSLNLHAKIYTDLGGYDDPFNAKHDKNHMERVPLDDLVIYAGGDTDAVQQSADTMREHLKTDPVLANFYLTIVHPAARAFENIERRGVLVDPHELMKVRDMAVKEIKTANDIAMSLLPNKMRIKYRDRIEDQLADDKNPMLPSILNEFFFTPDGLNLKPKMTTPTGKPSTAKAHLTMFHDVPECVAMVNALTTVNVASKIKGTFIDGFLKHLRPDNRFHPSYMLFHGGFGDDANEESGSTTGRLSAKEPAIQTLPKKNLKGRTAWAKLLRKAYIAPPGKVILQLDYSQGELRVVAVIANEKTMIEAYLQGLDLHAVTGAQIADIDLALFMSYKNNQDKKLAETYDDARDRAKPANFGLLYAMSAEGFVDYAWASYGRVFTLKEATAIREAFFKLYPGLLDYHDEMKSIVRKFKEVRSPLGRVRHLQHIDAWDKAVKAKAERQAINSPVQACLTDMMIWAIALLEDAYRNEEFEVFAVIHDAVYAYVDADKVELRTKQAKEIMQGLPFHKLGWEPCLPFPADASAGLNLAQLQDVKIAA